MNNFIVIFASKALGSATDGREKAKDEVVALGTNYPPQTSGGCRSSGEQKNTARGAEKVGKVQ